ncbi:unnamed protein product [Brassica napus]|uniref:(rape) hypothetical protein n=1 Tax=Brassica napus TaxID=3708 RepID=A0A816IX55_BRANA|nr:unnamed protein product [Brassica napus]
MLLSMAMMVTTPPSCIQPPPDQPPSSCLNTLLSSRCYSPHTAPPLTMFPSGPDFTTPSSFPLHFLSSLLRLLLVLETPELLSSREASPDLVVLTSSIICIASQI